MTTFARVVTSIAVSAIALFPAQGEDVSPADLQDLADRSSVFGGNVKALRATVRDLDAGSFDAALEKLEREANVVAEDAADFEVKSLARALGEVESALKKLRRQVDGDESYFMKERAGDIDTRLEAIETRAVSLARDAEKLAEESE